MSFQYRFLLEYTRNYKNSNGFQKYKTFCNEMDIKNWVTA